MEKLQYFKTSVLGFGCFVFVEKLTQLSQKLLSQNILYIFNILYPCFIWTAKDSSIHPYIQNKISV